MTTRSSAGRQATDDPRKNRRDTGSGKEECSSFGRDSKGNAGGHDEPRESGSRRAQKSGSTNEPSNTLHAETAPIGRSLNDVAFTSPDQCNHGHCSGDQREAEEGVAPVDVALRCRRKQT